MIDEVPVPDRLENAVAEAEHHQVLHRLFAQIVIDAVDLPLFQYFLDVGIQGAGRLQVMAKRFFDDHAPPLAILLLGHARGAKLLHNFTEKAGSHGKIVKEIALGFVLVADLN